MHREFVSLRHYGKRLVASIRIDADLRYYTFGVSLSIWKEGISFEAGLGPFEISAYAMRPYDWKDY